MKQKFFVMLISTIVALPLLAGTPSVTSLSPEKGETDAAEVDEYVESYLVGLSMCDFDMHIRGFDKAVWKDHLNESGCPQECQAVLVDPQVLAAYAGQYQFPNDMVVTVRVDGTRIFIQVPNQPEYKLYARSENQFYPREFEAEITFYKNANGKVDRLAMSQFGETNEAKKVP